LQCVAACCSVLQRVAVCCSVLQCVAVCCSVLQCVAECCQWLFRDSGVWTWRSMRSHVTACECCFVTPGSDPGGACGYMTHSYVIWLIPKYGLRPSSLAAPMGVLICQKYCFVTQGCDPGGACGYMTYSYVIWLIGTWLTHRWYDLLGNGFGGACGYMTHSYVIWLIHMWYDSFICDMIHSWMRVATFFSRRSCGALIIVQGGVAS